MYHHGLKTRNYSVLRLLHVPVAIVIIAPLVTMNDMRITDNIQEAKDVLKYKIKGNLTRDTLHKNKSCTVVLFKMLRPKDREFGTFCIKAST